MPPKAKSKVTKASKSRTTKGKTTSAPAQTKAQKRPKGAPKSGPKTASKPEAAQVQSKAEIQQNAKILSIPTEIQTEILSYLPVLDQISAVKVCKSWKDLLCNIGTLRRTRYPAFRLESIPYIPGRAGVHHFFQNWKILCTLDYEFEGIEKIYLHMDTRPVVGVDEIKENGYWLDETMDITDSDLLDDLFLSPFGFELAGAAKKLDSGDKLLRNQNEMFEASRERIETSIILDTASRWEEPYVDSMSFKGNDNLSIRRILEDHVNEICWKVNSGEMELSQDEQVQVHFEVGDAKQLIGGKRAWTIWATIYAPN
ncbi:hypothetical protein TWF694_002583 [Orbilia ellipsospora]|uniref:F-box domain-containing protein n=1 Tax=Orbilia ellipsospora TaxID=2528407 RepID=A0AAV9X8I3_9PEZI